jgi:hypothetical protein
LIQVLINQLVLPATNVEHCITSITEVKVKDLEQVAVTQKLVKKLLTPGSTLVGHSLNHALAGMLSPLLSPLFKDSRTV